MEQLYRALQLHQLLITSKIPPSKERCLRYLECSASTFKRILDAFRNELHAPLIYDRKSNGYRYDTLDGQFNLPGYWFNQSELFALLMAEQLFDATQSGVLSNEIGRLKTQIRHLLGPLQLDESAAKIRLRTVSRQQLDPEVFLHISRAVLGEYRICIDYRDSNHKQEEREVSPQYLLWYRDNWYLTAWCHIRDGLRIFALSRIHSTESLTKPAMKCTDEQLSALLGNGYGIFAGGVRQQAELLFELSALPWVENVCWHPEQQQTYLPDGRLRLSFPYTDHRELLRDLLRFSGEVEVLEPIELRSMMISTLHQGLEKYQEKE